MAKIVAEMGIVPPIGSNERRKRERERDEQKGRKSCCTYRQDTKSSYIVELINADMNNRTTTPSKTSKGHERRKSRVVGSVATTTTTTTTTTHHSYIPNVIGIPTSMSYLYSVSLFR